MGTADWGIWTDPPASKTASAKIAFGEWNQMIASGNLGYLATGLQNTSIGHVHNGQDSRLLVTPPVSALATDTQTLNAPDWTNVPGWSAVLTATASAILRYSMAIGHLWGDNTFGTHIRAAIITASASGTASALGAAIGQVDYQAGNNNWGHVSFAWWTAVPSGLIKILGQISGTGNLYGRTIEADLRQTG